MNKAWIALIILIGLLIVACQSEPTPTGTPASAPTIGRPPFGAAPVSAISLLRNPADFVDHDIELTGQYKPLPLLVCAEDTHTSPATWAIVDGEIEILASGFDNPLRELADTGLDLVVEGRWQQWEGPVGCGRRVPAEKIWYLAVSNIVSPNPLIADDGGGDGIAQLPPDSLPNGTGDEPLSPTPLPAAGQPSEPGEDIEPTNPAQPTLLGEPAGNGTPTVVETATPVGTRIVPLTATAQIAGTVSVTSPAGATATATSTPTSQANATPMPSQTGGATSPPTATSANTATATAVAGTSTPIGYEDLTKRTISANDSHTYVFVASSDDTINIVAAPENGLDVSIELIGPAGNSLQTQGQVGAGQVESLGPYNISQDGLHQVILSSVNSGGDYALVVQKIDSLPFLVFKGNMAYGDTVGNSIPADQDDVWNFMGSAGDVITIRAVATTDTDLVLYLNGPDSIELDFADEDLTIGPPNDVEEIPQLQLADDGMYTIGVGEIDFFTIGYTLTLTRN